MASNPLVPSITTPNAGAWYTGLISSRQVISDNTVKFTCTIPPGVLAPETTRFVREIYLNGTDTLAASFILAVGQPTTDVLYDPSGSVTLELELSLTNFDLTENVIFEYTQAQEIEEHRFDPNSHPDIILEMSKAGMFLPAGAYPFEYAGQNFDKKADFEGTKASVTYSGVTFTAKRNGTQGNVTLVFNGTSSVNTVVIAHNDANPDNIIEFSPPSAGPTVLAAGNAVLTGGTLAVNNGDLVYKDTDGFYKQALADATIKSKVVGVADTVRRIVRGGGFVAQTTGYPVGTDLFLSDSTPGAFQDTPSLVKVAVVLDSNTIFLSTFGGGTPGNSQNFDAVVSDDPGVNFFSTTQEAIDSVASGDRILVDKIEEVSTTINTGAKELTFVFNGPDTGYNKFLGSIEEQLIEFSSVPTSGTFRLEWNGQESADLPYTSVALDLENAFNLFTGHNGVTVSGDYSVGFTFTFLGTPTAYPQITFIDPGLNEIQRLSFSDVPDNGTFRLELDGNLSPFIAFNDDTAQIESDLESMPNITDVQLTGDIVSGQIDVQFINADGLQNINAFTLDSNTLERLSVPVSLTLSTVQDGKTPSSNLKTTGSPVSITVTRLSAGAPVGTTKAFDINANNVHFFGIGLVNGFEEGIDLNNHTGIDIEMLFTNTTYPIIGTDSIRQGVDFHVNKSFGLKTLGSLEVAPKSPYLTLTQAVAAASAGDTIRVYSDQEISSPLIINKAVYIEFVGGAKIISNTLIAGDVVTLDSNVQTRNLRLVLLAAGSYDNAIKFLNDRGYHENIEVELSSVSTILDKAFVVGTTGSRIYATGSLMIGAATVNTVLDNLSSVLNHDIVIRDKDNGNLLDFLNRSALIQETPSGVVDGSNRIFTLSQAPLNQAGTWITVDDQLKRAGIDYNLVNNNEISFVIGNAPSLGQTVFATYMTTNLSQTPASGRPAKLNVRDTTGSIEANTNIIVFDGFDVQSTGPNEVTVTPGTSPATQEVVFYRQIGSADLLAKQVNLPSTPFDATKVKVDIVGGSSQEESVDFVVTGSVLGWETLGLESLLFDGSKLRISYFT